MSSNEEMGSADNGFEEVAKPHYRGHRERLRKRFREGGGRSLPDYEPLELMLFRAMPRPDAKPLAKAILARFGTFADEIQQERTVDHTPSQANIEMTKQIVEAAEPLGVMIHDHIVVGKQGHASFRGLGLI